MFEAIINLLKELFGFGSAVIKSKGNPLKKVSIESEAIKDADKDYRIIEKRNDKEEKERWFATVKLLGLSRRHRKKVNRKINNLIKSDQEITSIERVGDTVEIHAGEVFIC